MERIFRFIRRVVRRFAKTERFLRNERRVRRRRYNIRDRSIFTPLIQIRVKYRTKYFLFLGNTLFLYNNRL